MVEVISIFLSSSDKILIHKSHFRNEVWRYNVKAHGTHRSRVIGFFFRGLPLGIAAFAATIAAEKAFDIDFHGDHMAKHGGGGHH